MHYLVTGHTGFKGAWLTLLLKHRGHELSGISLDPEPGSLFSTARISELLTHDVRLDIRNSSELSETIASINPDVLIHMAAQPLVRESYRDPRFTFETNALGTLNVLDAARLSSKIKAILIVTTDKVYKNRNVVKGYVETDSLGGEDPYSASKAMADILTQSWIASFDGPPTAIVRGGNVIGGGDVSKERLLVDLIASFQSGKVAQIRYPNAVRPWQHVLDCIDGYLAVVEDLLNGGTETQWNIGPGSESFIEVSEVADLASKIWGGSASWATTLEDKLPEAGLLALDATKAEVKLNWSNRILFPESLNWTIKWYLDLLEDGDSRRVTINQIERFEMLSSPSTQNES